MPTTITGNSGVSQVQAGATSDGLPMFQCRAWVNFDGTRDSTGAASTANTARFIRASGNVSSVVRNGAGDYTITFTSVMPDANYTIAGTSGNGITGFNPRFVTQLVNTASSVRVMSANASSAFDDSWVSVAIFR